MAGHSHWAGIKHKKGRQDKIRSKIFSKISREIMVAAKIGSKDPDTNHRLRAAIESAKEANMPKENIKRAINKSDVDKNKKFENLNDMRVLDQKILLSLLKLLQIIKIGLQQI